MGRCPIPFGTIPAAARIGVDPFSRETTATLDGAFGANEAKWMFEVNVKMTKAPRMTDAKESASPAIG
jgi:hypothetical protein